MRSWCNSSNQNGMHIGLSERDSKGNPPFYAITYSDVIPGPKLDLEKLKGVVVTVTGKIQEYGQTGFASVDVKSTSQIVPHRLERAQVEANGQQSAAKPSSASQSGSQPISAEVVDIPAAQAQFGIKAGNIKVSFSDGHTEVWTHSGDCRSAKVSPKGNVGWIRIAKRETLSPSGKTIALNNDSLVVHLLDGTTKKFPPFGENHFIPDWSFADDDKAVIVRSGGYHGPASYVQYDLTSGKVIDSRGNGYTPYAELPAWAKPLADPNE
jgi:hypothetical protein